MPNAANAAFKPDSAWHAAVVKAARAGDIDDARAINDRAKAGDIDEANRLGREYLEPSGTHSQAEGCGGGQVGRDADSKPELAGGTCLWCDGPFPPRKRGGSKKRFCSDECRLDFHKACRIWAMKQVDAHLLPIADLKRPAG